ncbi:MAG: hypothetical protein JJU11_11880 [Candidatus Sumerlaeia bacterium]|nr:hypothetical protein [Candidatus Sumerlaeia bacterium]
MPDVHSVHYDVALTNVSIAYRNPGFIARELAPEVSVRKQSDRYFIHDPERETIRSTWDGRAPGTEATEVDFALSSDSYYCSDHALESALPDEERENADAPLQPQVERVEFLTEKILLNQEANLAGVLRKPGNLPGVDLGQTGQDWNDSSVDPVAQIEEGRDAILAAVQAVPNVLVLPHSVYTVARNHPKIVERVKYSSLGVVGTGVLAELFDVEKVLVARAFQNVAPRGQEPDLAPIWGDDVLLLHVPQRPSLKMVAPALTFIWGQALGSSRGSSVQTWREERRKATMIRVQKYYDQKIVAPGAGYILRNAVS